MSGFVGADVEQLLALATRLDLQSQKFTEIATSSTAALMVAAWTGANIDHVRDEWKRRSRPAIAASARALAVLAMELRKQAQQQEVASKVGAFSSPSEGWGSPAQVHSKAVDVEKLNNLLDGIYNKAKGGATAASLLLEFDELMRSLLPGVKIRNFTDLVKRINGLKLTGPSDLLNGLKGFKIGSFLSLAGMIFSANDLRVALGKGHEADSIEAGFDLAAGLVGVVVPGAGLAWEAGKFVGEKGLNAVQPLWNTTDSAYNSAVEDRFGPDIDPNNLTQDQAAIMTKRYDGPGGVFWSISDSMRGAGRDFVGHFKK